MQNTQYESVVIATIENFASTIANTAHDSVVENGDYGVADSLADSYKTPDKKTI